MHTISFVQLYHFNSTIFVCNLLNRSSVTYTCSHLFAEWHRTKDRTRWSDRLWCQNEWAIHDAERCWHQFTRAKAKREKSSRSSSNGSSNSNNERKYKNIKMCCFALCARTRGKKLCAPSQRSGLRWNYQTHLTYLWVFFPHRFFCIDRFFLVRCFGCDSLMARMCSSMRFFLFHSFTTVIITFCLFVWRLQKRTLRKMLLFRFPNKTVCFRFSIWFSYTAVELRVDPYADTHSRIHRLNWIGSDQTSHTSEMVTTTTTKTTTAMALSSLLLYEWMNEWEVMTSLNKTHTHT